MQNLSPVGGGYFLVIASPPHIQVDCSYETFCKPKWCKQEEITLRYILLTDEQNKGR